MRRAVRRILPGTFWAGSLLALLIIALFLEGVPVIHAHVDGEPGLYNAACSLSLLAVQTSGAPLPTLELPGSRLPEPRAPIETADSSPTSPLASGSDSRAPPAA